MIYKNTFNSDARALAQRIKAHEKFGVNDLNAWIFQNIELHSGLYVLELGCGTGKQTLPIVDGIGEEGRVVCVDISEKALEILKIDAGPDRVTRIQTVHSDMDAIGDIVQGLCNRPVCPLTCGAGWWTPVAVRASARPRSPQGIATIGCQPAGHSETFRWPRR